MPMDEKEEIVGKSTESAVLF